jgi:hypothetical protein
MNKKLNEIYKKNISETYVIDKKGVVKSMEDAYNLGITDVFKWLSNMDYLTDNIQYIIDEWNSQNNTKI